MYYHGIKVNEDGKVEIYDEINNIFAYNGDEAGSDLILMQYTGLKDKNGKEIYENCIVKMTEVLEDKIREYVTPVIWEDGAFIMQSGKNDYDTFFHAWYKDENEGYPLHEIELLGNIYENPELATN